MEHIWIWLCFGLSSSRFEMNKSANRQICYLNFALSINKPHLFFIHIFWQVALHRWLPQLGPVPSAHPPLPTSRFLGREQGYTVFSHAFSGTSHLWCGQTPASCWNPESLGCSIALLPKDVINVSYGDGTPALGCETFRFKVNDWCSVQY